jgi:hypothetical protein
MAKIVLKATVILLVGLFLVAAGHEMVPGLCVAPTPDGRTLCPFCQLIYTLIVILAVITALPILRLVQMCNPALPELPPRTTHRTTWSLRAPPACCF